MSEFRVIIAGGRDFNDYDLLEDFCDQCLASKDRSEVITLSGKARGADTLGEKYARHRGFRTRYFPADWDRYGKMAGMKRNMEMIENADALIAFWDGKSKGTAHVIREAKLAGLKVRIKRY